MAPEEKAISESDNKANDNGLSYKDAGVDIDAGIQAQVCSSVGNHRDHALGQLVVVYSAPFASGFFTNLSVYR